MTGLARILRRAAAWGAIGGGFLILIAALVVSLEVILRKLFSVSLSGADEISGYLFAVGTAWSFAFVIAEKANVRIDALYLALPPMPRLFLDLFGALALTLFLSVLAYRSFFVVLESARNDAHSVTPLQTPLVWPQALWWIGLVFALALLLIHLVLSVRAALRGRVQIVTELIGSQSVSTDEVESQEGRR